MLSLTLSDSIIMAPHDHQQNPNPAWRWQPLVRRRKAATVRLGGKRRRGRMVVVALRMAKKMRLKWVKLQYLCVLRKLKEYYRKLVKDLIEAGPTMESFHHRMFMETTFGIPAVAPVSLRPPPSLYV